LFALFQFFRTSLDTKPAVESGDIDGGYVVLDTSHNVSRSYIDEHYTAADHSFNDERQAVVQKDVVDQGMQHKDDLNDFFDSVGMLTTSTPKQLTKKRSNLKLVGDPC